MASWQMASKDFVFSLMLQSLLAESNFFEQFFNCWSVCVVHISILGIYDDIYYWQFDLQEKKKKKLVMHDAY